MRLSRVGLALGASTLLVLVAGAAGVGAVAASAAGGGRIVFEREAGNVGIYVMNGDGSGLRRLTRNPWDDGSPAWSPDGRRIAFVSGRTGSGEIYVMNSDGTRQRRLTRGAGVGAGSPPPAWSPDGRRIAFTQGNSQVWVMNADGSRQHNLTPKPWDGRAPAWSPDGRTIAFESSRRGNYDVYLMNADDGGGKRVLVTGPEYDGQAAWSPDGRWIAFQGGPGGISVVSSAGGRPRLLTKEGDQPAWAPDGRRIAFRRWDGDNPEIAVMASSGSGQRLLTRALPYTFDGFPSWTARMPKPSRWVITDLGTLGGRQSSAAAINDSGQIVGQADTANGLEHAFFWQKGKMRDINPLGDPYIRSSAAALSHSGQALVDTRQSYPTQRRRAFLWDNGALTEIAGLGGQEVVATAINERGQIIGTDNSKRAFLWQNGVTSDLGGLGGTSTFANAINDSGQIVGSSETAAGPVHAFLWENGNMKDLGTLGGTSSLATAIDSRGWISGFSDTAAGETHAFLWSSGQMADLGTAGRSSFAFAANDNGRVVGHGSASTGAAPSGFLWDNGLTTSLGAVYPVAINERGQIIGTSQSGFSSAVIWEDGVISKLPTLGGLSNAAAINRHDQIVGTSNTRAQSEHAVLWTRTKAT